MPTHARHRIAGVALAALVAAHLALGWQLVRLSRNHLNPDGIAYIEMARHYVEGRFDLAITSYWAPLLSWLLAIAIALGYDPLLAARALILGATLAFAFGVRSLTRELTTGTQASGFRLQASGPDVAFAAALLLSLTMLPRPVTPDVPLAAGITWYLVFVAPLALRREKPAEAPTESVEPNEDTVASRRHRRAALLAGVTGGASYLIKSYALPFVLAHIALTALLRLVTVRTTLAVAFRDALLTMVCVLAVAGPWIVLISVQEGRATFSGVGRFTRPWNAAPLVNPEPEEFFGLATPRQGRLAVWENPDEIPTEWTGNPNEPRGFRNFLDKLWNNAGRAWQSFRNADPLGVLSLGLMLAVVMVMWRVAREGIDATRLWALASLTLYGAGYVLIYVEARYLWPVFGLMIAIAVSTAVDVLDRWHPARTSLDSGGHGGPALGDYRGPVSGRHWGRPLLVYWLAMICLLGSLGFGVWREVIAWSQPDSIGVDATRLRTFGEALRGEPPIAANDWPQGIFISYWSRAPFLGQYHSHDPDDISRELAPFGNATVLVFDDPGLASHLRDDPRFETVPLPVDDDYFPAAFRFRAGR